MSVINKENLPGPYFGSISDRVIIHFDCIVIHEKILKIVSKSDFLENRTFSEVKSFFH